MWPNITDRTKVTSSTLRTMDGRNIYSHGNADARRRVASVNAIMLHQTSFVSGRVDRYDSVIANYVVMQNGHVLKVRNIEAALNSIATNQRAIDIEFVGDYPSWRSRASSPLPPIVQLKAGRDLVLYLKIRYHTYNIFGHVQFTAKNCPGPHIWYNVGERAVHNGMNNERGGPIPRHWSDSSLAILDPLHSASP